MGASAVQQHGSLCDAATVCRTPPGTHDHSQPSGSVAGAPDTLQAGIKFPTPACFLCLFLVPARADRSTDFLLKLLPPPPNELPSSSGAITAYMHDTAAMRIPVLAPFYQRFADDDHRLADMLVPADACKV